MTRIVKHKSKNNIEVSIVSGTKGESRVAKTFKKYIPYDLIADIYEGKIEEFTAVDFLKDICATMGEKYGKVIDYNEYDFCTGYYDREHPKPVTEKAVANKTSNDEQIFIKVAEMLDAKLADIKAGKNVEFNHANYEKQVPENVRNLLKNHALFEKLGLNKPVVETPAFSF